MTSLFSSTLLQERSPHLGLAAGCGQAQRSFTDTAHRMPAAACSMDSHELLRGHKTVEIVHNGSTYRLQATRLGKLILTK